MKNQCSSKDQEISRLKAEIFQLIETIKNKSIDTKISPKKTEKDLKSKQNVLLTEEGGTTNTPKRNRISQAQSTSVQSKTKKRFSQSKKTDPSPKKKLKEKTSGVYEVEQLLGHKMEKSELVYLVRWKHYGPEDDTWESESNLSCPKILAEYKRKMT